MNRLPWYKSNVLRGLLVASALQLALWFGVTDDISEADVQSLIDNLLRAAELGAVAFAAWARTRQPTPPITEDAALKMAQMSAAAQPNDRGDAIVRMHWSTCGIGLAIVLSMLVAGCETTPTSVIKVGCSEQSAAYRIERCADTMARVYHVYQQRGVEIVNDGAISEDVKRLVRQADATATPAVQAMLVATQQLLGVQEQMRNLQELSRRMDSDIDAAELEELQKQQRIAEDELERTVQQTIPLINRLIEAIGG